MTLSPRRSNNNTADCDLNIAGLSLDMWISICDMQHIETDPLVPHEIFLLLYFRGYWNLFFTGVCHKFLGSEALKFHIHWHAFY